jgi:hypothetical protein
VLKIIQTLSRCAAENRLLTILDIYGIVGGWFFRG